MTREVKLQNGKWHIQTYRCFVLLPKVLKGLFQQQRKCPHIKSTDKSLRLYRKFTDLSSFALISLLLKLSHALKQSKLVTPMALWCTTQEGSTKEDVRKESYERSDKWLLRSPMLVKLLSLPLFMGRPMWLYMMLLRSSGTHSLIRL